MNLTDRVIQVVSRYTGIAVENIKPGSLFVDLGCDSLDLVELVRDLEEEFETEITDEEVGLLQCPTDVLNLLLRREPALATKEF